MKATSFIQGLAKAQSEIESGKKTKVELQKRLNEVKKMADQPGSQTGLKEELEKLENSVMKVAEMEQQLLSKEDMDIKDLKFQIRDLKTRLSLTGAEGLKPSLDKIAFLLGELTSRVDTYTKIKTDREVRMEELEKKIKDNMETNFKELKKIEDILERLEKQYETIKKSGQADKETLIKTKEKISGLREKVIEKRQEIVEKKKQDLIQRRVFLPAEPIMTEPIRPERPVPPPKFFSVDDGVVKHKMMFPNVPAYKPTEKNSDFMMPPMPKPEKKGFFGWIKGLFGR